MDSLEKLNRALHGANDLVPEDEATARNLQVLQVIGPMIGPMIPDSAEDFDDMLLGIGKFVLGMRSDEADPEAVVNALAELYGYGAGLAEGLN